MFIRVETPGDTDGVYAVEVAAFQRRAEADLVDELRSNAGVTLSLVAEEDGMILGHVLFSPVRVVTPDGSREGQGMGPVAVEPTRQRQGIGSALIRDGLDRLRRAGHAVVVVEGSPHYYSRFGFQDALLLGLECEFNPPPGCFMVLELHTNGLDGVRGKVFYRPEFQAVG